MASNKHTERKNVPFVMEETVINLSCVLLFDPVSFSATAAQTLQPRSVLALSLAVDLSFPPADSFREVSDSCVKD